MPTFRSKEIVDARQFTGGQQNAIDVANWVKAQDPEYYSSSEYKKQVVHSRIGSVEDENVTLDDQLIIHVYNGHHLFAGSWMVHREDGRWMVYYDEYFKAKFEQV